MEGVQEQRNSSAETISSASLVTKQEDKKKRKKLSVWIASSEHGKVTKIECSVRTLTVVSCSVLCGAALLLATATEYGRLQLTRARDILSVKELSVALEHANQESREALAAKEALETQMAKILKESNRSKEYEERLKGHLSRLNTVIQAISTLGLIDKNTLQATPVKGKGGFPTQNSLSVGGLEIDCRTSKGPEAKSCAKSGAGKSSSVKSPNDKSTKGKLGLVSAAHADQETDRSEWVVRTSAEKTSRKGADMLAEIQHYTNLLKTIPLGAPANGDISSLFGVRESPFGDGTRMHQGIDVTIPYGSEVYSTGDGVVHDVRKDSTYGTLVEIQHSTNVMTRYAHLSKALVKPGQKVDRGEVLALSGSSGRSTGPHLHYEVRVRGEAKDPMKFFKLAQRLEELLLF